MFNKTSKPTSRETQVPPTVTPPADVSPALNLNKITPAPSSAPLRNSGAKGLSSFGAGLIIEGNITGTGDLVLEGTVHGDVKVSHLTVGDAGNVEGKVEADTIEIRGRVVGSIKGQQVKLQATAYVEGDITHEQLAIDVGAYFQGRCLQTRRVEQPAAAVAPANASVAAPVQPAAPAPAAASGTASGPSLGSYDLNALADLK